MADGDIKFRDELGLTITQQRPTYIMQIMNDSGEDLVRILPNGNVEILGDVNEAAMRFWLAIANFADGDLIKKVRERIAG